MPTPQGDITVSDIWRGQQEDNPPADEPQAEEPVAEEEATEE